MGKDLKNRELGVGLDQRKDGLYRARFTDKHGKRKQKCFTKLQDCRQYLADIQFKMQHEDINALGEMTVNAWFDYWITNIKGNAVRPGTINTYKSLYNNHIKDYIGNIFLNEVKPLHCQNILNQLAKTHRTSFIQNVRGLLYSLMADAVENDLIIQNPVKKSIKCVGNKEKEKRVLTKEEQSIFLNEARKSKYYNQYAFILQTGLRTGELVGLKWSDIDFRHKNIFVQRTIRFDSKTHRWISGDPKTAAGKRKIPLTREAIFLLQKQKEMNRDLKIVSLEFEDVVFLSKKGTPIKNSAYDAEILKLCREAEIKKISMHTLRHTFATRCIEAGMKPKTLQMLLGHNNLDITMNLYVHITEDEKIRELNAIEQMLKII